MNIIKVDNRDNFTEIFYKESFLDRKTDYQNLINNIIQAFIKVEYLTVVEGTRDAHLTFIRPTDVESKTKYFEQYGLSIVLLNKEADNAGRYGNHAKPYVSGESFVWRSIVTRPELINYWEEVWKKREEDVPKCEYLIGRGLGYPDCCAKHFAEIWINRGGIDTTWQQAACTAAKTSDYNIAETILCDHNAIQLPETTPIWASNLLRWVGPKLVSHLPCSFDCKESKRIALENIAVATKHGFGYEYHKLCRMLEWEISWTAESGIALLETPAFVVTTVTDVTTIPYKVIKKGHNNCIL